MENATEALMMGFAVLIFVIALTVSINAFNQVKAVSDLVLYTKDETNYYDYQGVTGKAAQNRIVGLETIIPTLYKYSKENYTVLFREGSYDMQTGEFGDIKPLTLYNSPSSNKGWSKNYETLMENKYNSYMTNGYIKQNVDEKIFSFDLEEETLRHEPWTGSYEKVKENLDCFLYGKVYKNPNNNNTYIDYSRTPLMTGGFIAKYKNAKFVETIGEYTYSNSQANDTEEENSLKKEKKKRIIVFTLISNN